MSAILYLVIPCYNEEEMLPITSEVLLNKREELIRLGKISPKSRILFVNDGSKDATWDIIRGLHEQNPAFSGLNLSRNRGHQNALLAGLMYAKDHCDISISMDADLQDDPNAINGMIERYEEGCDIVYGVRDDRKEDTFFKRKSAEMFYRLMTLLGTEVRENSADFRLISKRALEALSEFREVNLFLRGMIPLLGFKEGIVKYKRGSRAAGESKYPLRKMLAFSFEGITSFSIVPIRMITYLGVLIFLISLLFLIWGVVQKFRGLTVQGWSSLITSVWAIGGLILLAIGVVGEYIGKIYLEVKARPRYIIEEILD